MDLIPHSSVPPGSFDLFLLGWVFLILSVLIIRSYGIEEIMSSLPAFLLSLMGLFLIVQYWV